MQSLSIDKAHTYVLQSLDEMQNAEGVVMLGESDAIDTKKLVEGYIIEAVLKAHRDAPSHLLDGTKGTAGTGKDYTVTIHDDLSADIKMLKPTARLISIQEKNVNTYYDVVTDYASEESPIGRMQKNQYVKGTYDDPRLINKKIWASEKQPEYVFYSVKSKESEFVLEYFPYPEVNTEKVNIADKMEYAVLNLITSMVLDSLSYHEKATLYKNKYQEYLQTAR